MSPEQIAAHEGHARRAQPDARTARARRRARLRGVHGSLRRLLPRESRRPSTSCSSRWRSRWRHAAAAQLDEPRTAGASSRSLAERVARRHGPALADGPARPEPPAARSRRWGGARACDFGGDEPLRFAEMRRPHRRSSATSTRSRTCCATPTEPGALAEVDLDRARAAPRRRRRAFAATALASWPACSRRRASSSSAKGRMELTPKGIRRIGQHALGDLFRRLPPGPRRPPRSRARRVRATSAPTTTRPTSSATRSTSTSTRTLKNAIARAAVGHPGPHHPRGLRDRAHGAGHARRDGVDARRVALDADARATSSPAKKVAMALHALITQPVPPRLPRHGRASAAVAREVKPERLPEATWDFEWGTNMQHALAAQPPDAVQPERPQADHHDHRRRADRPHRRRLCRTSTTRRRRAPSR